MSKETKKRQNLRPLIDMIIQLRRFNSNEDNFVKVKVINELSMQIIQSHYDTIHRMWGIKK